jgi:hypothetical protein
MDPPLQTEIAWCSSKVIEGDFAEAEGQVSEDVQSRNHLEYR